MSTYMRAVASEGEGDGCLLTPHLGKQQVIQVSDASIGDETS
jgi:hypothetical protein